MALHPQRTTTLCLFCRYTVQPYQRTSIAVHPTAIHHLSTASEQSSNAGTPPPPPLKQLSELRHKLRTQERLSSPLDSIYGLLEMKAPRKIPLFDNSLKKAIEAVHPDMKSTSTLEDVYSQAHHHMIVAQLSECNDINSFLRIAYTCFKQPSPAHNVRVLSDYLIRNVYHFHSRGVSYDELLAAVHTIRFRLVDQGLELPQSLLIVGVVLGACCHSYPSIHIYLEFCAQKGYLLDPPIHFRNVLDRLPPVRIKNAAKEEKRRRFTQQETDAVLVGKPDPSIKKLQTPISAMLNRTDCHVLDYWLRRLAAGGHSEHLWTEWELWLKNRASTQLTAADSANTPKRFVRSDGSLDLQTWIDLCFVDCFISLSDWEKAWAVVSHSKIAPEMLSRGSLDQLIEHSEHEPADYWKSSGDLLRDLYARKLHAIEKSLGVKWVWKEDEGMGWHVIDIGRENVFESASIELEKLATPEATSDEISPQFFTPVEDRKEVPPKKEKDVIGSSGDSWLDDYM